MEEWVIYRQLQPQDKYIVNIDYTTAWFSYTGNQKRNLRNVNWYTQRSICFFIQWVNGREFSIHISLLNLLYPFLSFLWKAGFPPT